MKRVHPRKLHKKGFTLVELLIVVAIIGILTVGLIAAINPVEKINLSSDARAISDIGVLSRASESFSTLHGGFYPASSNGVVPSELRSVPTPPNGYSYVYNSLPAACVSGTTCTSVTITTQLKSNKYSANPFIRFESSTGRTCYVATATTACP